MGQSIHCPSDSVCTSSSNTTEFAMLCSFRHLEVPLAKSDSMNCTDVVTMTGASQFSAASFSEERACLVKADSGLTSIHLHVQAGALSERDAL